MIENIPSFVDAFPICRNRKIVNNIAETVKFIVPHIVLRARHFQERFLQFVSGPGSGVKKGKVFLLSTGVGGLTPGSLENFVIISRLDLVDWK